MRDSTGTELHSELSVASAEGPLSTQLSHNLATSVESFRVSVESTAGSAKGKAGSSSSSFDSAIVERYRLEKLLGKGGFGEVWKAFDTQTGKYVAIKGPRTDRPISSLHVQQFLAEAEKARQIGSGAVVPVLEVVSCPARQTGEFLCFIVMELMAGGSLGERARKGDRPTTQQAVALVIRLADKLAQIHGHGFIHRDVKPDNILFDAAGNPYFSDFGLAVTDDEQLKEGQCVRGTVAYMAPEQARQQRVDRQADIYSLGVVLYQLLALPYVAQPKLALPFLANNSEEYLELLSDQRQQARALPEGVPSELASIVEHHCLTADKTQRYRNAQDLSRSLRQWLRRHTWPRRAALIAGCGLATAVAGYAVAGYAGYPTYEMEDQVTVSDQLGNLPLESQAWSIADDRTTLNVETAEIVLIALGTHQHDATEYEVTVTPEHWEGEFGVYFGHTQAREQLNNFYQALKLIRKSSVAVSLDTCGTEYQKAAPHGVHGTLGVHVAPGPPLAIHPKTNRIRVSLEAGKLAGVWINEIDLAERIVAPWLKSSLGEFGRSVGHFGLLCSGGPCRFTKPMLNGKPILLNQ